MTAEPVAPELSGNGTRRSTMPARRSTTSTASANPSGTMAMAPRAETPVGVDPIPPSDTDLADEGSSTGTMLSVLAVRFTASSTSCGSGSGALVSAQPARRATLKASEDQRVWLKRVWLIGSGRWRYRGGCGQVSLGGEPSIECLTRAEG